MTNTSSSTNGIFGKSYSLLAALGGSLQSPLLLAIRLYWGWQFAQTGWGKLTHLAKTAEYFKSLHIPVPSVNAAMAGGTECFGGLLLLAGLGSRLVCMPLAFTMIVAYITAESDAWRHILSDPDKFVSAAPFLFLFAVSIIFVFGPGRFSFDGVIGKKAAGKKLHTMRLPLS